jgi:hypothetical protein
VTDDPLVRYRPVLRFDSREPFAGPARGPAPGSVLRRADGSAIARPPLLSLDYPRPGAYADGQKVEPGDYLERPSLPGTVYGRVATQKGSTWLQYWMWFALDQGHVGDWEMIQLLTGPSGLEWAVYAQHGGGGQRAWGDVDREGDRSVVYVARATHATFFQAGSYLSPSKRWIDLADGATRIDPNCEPLGRWALWPGRWGETKHSPVAPCRHHAWNDPNGWAAKVTAEPQARRFPTLPRRRR